MNSTSDKSIDNLEEQLFELIYGLLDADEAQALRRRVTSEPDVARAYARVVQQSERIALAAQWEEPPLPLAAMLERQGRLQDDETDRILTPKVDHAAGTVVAPAAQTKLNAPPLAQVEPPPVPVTLPAAEVAPAERSSVALRWAAALAGGLVAAAVVVVACAFPPSSGRPLAENHLVHLSAVLSSNLAPQQDTVVVIQSHTSTGEPIAREFDYSLRSSGGEMLQSGSGATDASGKAAVNISLPESTKGVVHFYAQVAESPPVEAALGVERLDDSKATVTARVESDRQYYRENDIVRVRVASDDGRALPKDMQVVAHDQRGMTTLADGSVVDDLGDYRLRLPANPVSGEHVISAVTAAGDEIGSRSFMVRSGRRESDEKNSRDDFVVAGNGRAVEDEELGKAKHAERAAFRLRSSSIKANEPLQMDLDQEVGHKLLVVVKQYGNVVGVRLVESDPGETRELKEREISLPSEVRGPLTVEGFDLTRQPPARVGRYAVVREAEPTLSATLSPMTAAADDQLWIDIDVRDRENSPVPARLAVVMTYQADDAEVADGFAMPEGGRRFTGVRGIGGGGGEAVSGFQGLDFREQAWLARQASSEVDQLEGLRREEEFLSPVSYSAPRHNGLAAYRRLFNAGDVPPSLVFDGESEQLVAAQRDEQGHEVVLAGGTGAVWYEASVAPYKRSLPSPQVVNNSAAIESLRMAADAQAARGETLPLWWVAGFLGAGVVVLVIGGAVTLVRRPDPWTVWIPAGLVAAACFGAAAYHAWPQESTTTLAKGETSAPAAEATQLGVLARSPDDASGFVSLPALPRFAAGGEPSNEIFEVELAEVARTDAARPVAVQPLESKLPLPTISPVSPALNPIEDTPAQQPAQPEDATDPTPKEPARSEPVRNFEKKTAGKDGDSDRPLNRPESGPLDTAPRPVITAGPRGGGLPAGEVVAGAGFGTPGTSGVETRQPQDANGVALFDDNEKTVIWEPSAETDAQGRVRVLVPRPPGPGFYKLRITADRKGETVTTERVFRVK